MALPNISVKIILSREDSLSRIQNLWTACSTQSRWIQEIAALISTLQAWKEGLDSGRRNHKKEVLKPWDSGEKGLSQMSESVSSVNILMKHDGGGIFTPNISLWITHASREMVVIIMVVRSCILNHLFNTRFPMWVDWRHVRIYSNGPEDQINFSS